LRRQFLPIPHILHADLDPVASGQRLVGLYRSIALDYKEPPDITAGSGPHPFHGEQIMRALPLIACCLVSALAYTDGCFAATQSSKPIAPGGPDLKVLLEKGLRARRPVEFEFIDRVLKLVDEGKLPTKLVERCFLWSRNMQPYPFPYFERSMKEQALKSGVKIE
jgi:hypothetical protein